MQRNRHNVGFSLTETAFVFEYPPMPPNIKHAQNILLAIWEFSGGARAVPDSFKKAFAAYDLVIAPNEFVAEQFRPSTATPVQVVPYLGVDTAHFTPIGEVADWAILFPGEAWVQDAKRIILMVGGTDLRHGWDVALEILKRLPNDVHLVAKWDTHYPVTQFHEAHDRLHILHKDFSDLAPLYRAADMFLLTARGVGFSLPTIEALACGLPVASTPLPPIRDFATDAVFFGEGGGYVPLGRHHVHNDCLPDWWEPDVESMVDAVERALSAEKRTTHDPAWVSQWSWNGIARRFAEELNLVPVQA
jgi:glycosyltransferase involved in cell wall biosynthesis